MSSSSEVTRFLNRCKYPIISGFFAFLAGFAGKHAFSDDIGGLKEYSIVNLHHYNYYIIRGLFAVLMLYFNSLMIKFFVHSLQESGATLTTVMNFSFNFILSGISSFIYFNEPFRLKWLFGVSLILSGVFILSQNKSKQKTQITPKATETKTQARVKKE